MKFIRHTILILFILIIGFQPKAKAANIYSDTCEILLLGSSYFNFNELKDLIKNLAEDSEMLIYIEMHGQNGMYLLDHASSPVTEDKINERNWDYVVLQGVGVLMAYPDVFTDHPVYPALVTLRDKIKANCESTIMTFCLPWAFEDGMTWYQNWTDTYEEMQILAYENTLVYSNEIGFEIAPVGWTWYAVLKEKGYPLHYLHMNDWNHPSLKGSYLMACTIFSAVLQETTIGNPYTAGLPDDEVELFQSVASDTVLTHLDLWNITPKATHIDEFEILRNTQLLQNFPNPFSSLTTINYTIPTDSHVNISVFNILGDKVLTLVNELKKGGEHLYTLEGCELKNGIYYYQLNIEDYSLTKKMIVRN